MKALKIIGIIFGILAIGVAVAWNVFLVGPTEAELCGHLTGLMDAKLPGFSTSPPGAEFRESCPKRVAKGMLESQLKYVKRSKCVMAADSMDAVQACD